MEAIGVSTQKVEIFTTDLQNNTTDYTFKCGVCSNEFSILKDLRDHLKTHTKTEKNVPDQKACQNS